MTDLRAAAEMALEALEDAETNNDGEARWDLHRAATEALRTALAQPEQDHGFDRTASHMAGEYVDTAQHEQSSAMAEWRSMVVVNLLRRCPNLSKHELRELAAHFESRLPVAQPEQDDLTAAYLSGLYDGKKTAPPSKPWVSLTSEELASIVVDHAGYPTRQLAAIEAALRSKNNG